MNVLDRARIEWAVQSYGQWLDLRGASGKRRRALRRELRANLQDAASDSSAAEAVLALGSRRRMAAEAVPTDATRPHWYAGASWGLIALGLVLFVEGLCGLAWMDGVRAADETQAASGSITLFPASSLEYAPLADGGFSMSFAFGWLCLAVGLLGFVAVARPWRLVTGRRGGRTAGALGAS